MSFVAWMLVPNRTYTTEELHSGWLPKFGARAHTYTLKAMNPATAQTMRMPFIRKGSQEPPLGEILVARLMPRRLRRWSTTMAWKRVSLSCVDSYHAVQSIAMPWMLRLLL